MNKFRSILIPAICALVFFANSVWGNEPETNGNVRVALDLADGSCVMGAPEISSVSVKTSYAKMDVPLRQILSIKIEDDHKTALLELANGDRLKGVLELGPLKLGTAFGKASVGIEHIKNITLIQGGVQRGVLAPALSKSLVLYYSFDHDEGGVVSDNSGKGNRGKVHGAEWTSKGKIGGAYVFDGVDDYIDIDSDSSIPKGIGTGNFTIAVWLKVKTPPGLVIEQHIPQSPWTGIFLSIDPSYFRFRTDDTGGIPTSSILLDVSKIVDDEKWHHYVAVRDDSVLYLYLDGVKKVEKKVPLVDLNVAYAGPLRIGSNCQDGKDTNYNGVIDEVMIWSRALREKEVEQLYNSQK